MLTLISSVIIIDLDYHWLLQIQIHVPLFWIQNVSPQIGSDFHYVGRKEVCGETFSIFDEHECIKTIQSKTRANQFVDLGFKDIKYDILVCYEGHEDHEDHEGHDGHKGHEGHEGHKGLKGRQGHKGLKVHEGR